MKNKCIDCNRSYKTICDDGRCYYCFVEKWKKIPETGLYRIEKEEKRKS